MEKNNIMKCKVSFEAGGFHRELMFNTPNDGSTTTATTIAEAVFELILDHLHVHPEDLLTACEQACNRALDEDGNYLSRFNHE